MTYFHEPPAIRCVTCRRLFAGTVADVVANYRSHQCTPYGALFDPPHPYTNLSDLLASLHAKQIISVIPTLDDDDTLSELQFQFTDGTHFIVRGWGAGWEVDSYGVEITADLARKWWLP